MSSASHEFWAVFYARKVKAPELKGPDAMINGAVGVVRNRLPTLARLKRAAERVEKLEPEIHNLSAAKFQEAVEEQRDLARLNRLKGEKLDRAMAIVREGWFRA